MNVLARAFLVALFLLASGCLDSPGRNGHGPEDASSSDGDDGDAVRDSGSGVRLVHDADVRSMALRASRQVNEGGDGFEPSIEVGPDGTIYITAAQGLDRSRGAEAVTSSRLWVSADGASFAEVEPVGMAGVSNLPYGMEGDLAVSLEGIAYFVDLTLASVTLSSSTDGGSTWLLRNPAVFAAAVGDREWVAAGPGNLVAVTWINTAPPVGGQPARLWAAVSSDGGLTFPVQTSIPDATEAEASGIAVTPDGRVLVANSGDDGVRAYVSMDGGATFERHLVHATDKETSYNFIAVDSDAAGNLYATWAEDTGSNTEVLYSASSDGGATWTRPVRVSGASGAAALPWIDAAEDGHVAIAYYGAPGAQGIPDDVSGPWFPFLVDVRDAASASPRLARLQMASEPVLRQAICTQGFKACGGTPPLGDYLQVAIGPDGADHVAWVDEGRQVFWGVAGLGRGTLPAGE